MSLDVNFDRIKIIDNSRQTGFEEFCCQIFFLAKEYLNLNDDAHYYRKRGAGGDGGVEAYWKSAAGTEIGIQAKYFLSLDDNSWKQIRNSVNKAKSTHPDLKKYIICFPIDLTDSRKPDTISNQDKFNNLKQEFNDIEIIFWGSSQLIYFLEKKPELLPFWFDKIQITKEDFIKNFEIFRDNIGLRYQPEIHIELDNFDYFDYLEQNKSFIDKFERNFINFKHTISSFRLVKNHLKDEMLKEKINKSSKDLYCKLESTIYTLKQNHLYNVEYKYLIELTKIFLKAIEDLSEDDIEENEYYKHNDYYRDRIEIINELQSIYSFFTSNKTKINEHKLLFLNGSGGAGKTHHLASIVDKRIKQNLVSLIFDASQFNTDTSIPDNIKKYFGGTYNSDKEFFSALDTIAYLSGERGVIFIDGLDENTECKKWQNKISHFIREMEKYDNLAVAISYRTEYEGIVLPKAITKNRDLFCTATGFLDIPVEKLAKIFNKYNIDIPTVPALYPEFYNPLFLILYCNSVSHRELFKAESFLLGYINIFQNYLKSINFKISNKLDIDERKNIIQKFCYDIAAKMYENKTNYITEAEAIDIANHYHQTASYSMSLLTCMLSDGFIYKFCNYKDSIECIRFAFGKFSDYLIICSILDEEFDETEPLKCFRKGSKLYQLAHNTYRPTFLEMLAISIAEYTKGRYEILDIFDKEENFFDDRFNPYTDYFLKSVTLRNAEFINEKTKELLFKYCTDEIKLLEILLEIAIKPNCKYDVNYIHNNLKNMKLFKRDYSWSLKINYIYKNENDNIIKKIINYCWNSDNNIKGEKYVLGYSILLCWFLSATNRELRDKTTKALTNVFVYNLDVVPQILKKFDDVNDMYIKERLYCAVYGACLRNQTNTENHKKIKEIALTSYNLIFKGKNVSPHMLLRDYAKNIIEFAIQICGKLDLDISNIKPPYNSKYPQIPSKKTIDKIYKLDGEYKFCHAHDFLKEVYSSVSGLTADFGNYVVEYYVNKISDSEKPYLKKYFSNGENMLTEKAKRWLLKRVSFLCDYKNLPEEFSDRVVYNGRQRKTTERLGKKYQWIALYEFMGYALDKYINCESDISSKPVKYNNAIQISRDIDPTLTSKQFLPHNTDYSDIYNDFIPIHSDSKTCRSWCTSMNVPNPSAIILQKFNEKDYFNLCSFYMFESKFDSDIETDNNIEFYWFLKSYIVPQNNLKKADKFFKDKTFDGRWMPEENEYGDIYNAEYSMLKYIDETSFKWITKNDFHSFYKPDFKMKKTAAKYFNDSSIDCSYDNIMDFYIPSPVLIKEMGLEYGDEDGLFKKNGKVIFINPYFNINGKDSLLVEKDEFLKFLSQNKYKIFWTIGGEKIIKEGKVDITGFYHWEDELKGDLRFSDFEIFPRYKY